MNIPKVSADRNKNLPSAPPMACPRCEHTGVPGLTEAGPHIKATCAACGAYLKFLRRTDRSPMAAILRLIPRLDAAEKREVLRVLNAAPVLPGVRR